MDASSIIIFIAVGLFAAGFIYMNFIFPIKAEREEREKLQEQSSDKQNTKGRKGNNKR
jgi:hypothetical protein